MEVQQGDGPPKRKWKKKKTLLSNARKYAKKECWGRGTKISEDTYLYFVGILEVMRKGFDTEEEKGDFVRNVLERTEGEEITLSCNQLGCRVLEQLVRFAPPPALERFMDAFSAELRALCTDNFSSFVLESLLQTCCDRAVAEMQNDDKEDEECDDDDVKIEEGSEEDLKNNKKSSSEDEETKSKKRKIKNEEKQPPNKKAKEESESPGVYPQEHIEKCHNFTIKVAKYLLNNLEDFVWDPSANRILRTSLKCLGGIVSAPCEIPKQDLFGQKPSDTEDKKPEKNVKKHSLPLVYKRTPKEFKNIVKEHANRLTKWPQFVDMPYQMLTSGLIQMMIFSLKNCSKKLTKLTCKKMLNESFAPDSWFNSNEDDKKDNKSDEETNNESEVVKPLNLPPVFDSEPAVRVLEAMLYVARSKTYTQIYAKCFINRLAILSTMPGHNFTVQRLFDNCDVKEEFEPMFDELADKFDKILVCGNTGVLVAVAKACLRLQARQAKFIQALENSLECTDAASLRHFTPLCCRLLPLRRATLADHARPYFVSVHGSVLLQTLLSFQRPKRVVDAVMALPPQELVVLFCDAKGSHIADAFYDGKFVGAKSKEVLTKILRGTFQELAVSKHGSRSLEKVFNSSPPEQQLRIMEELADKGQALQASPAGRLLANKLKLELFSQSPARWRSAMDKGTTTKTLFKDIITKKT